MDSSPRVHMQSVGDVHLESSLGADAFSETFRGVLLSSRRPVFVRVFAPEVVGVRLVPGRFLREFEPLRDFEHPNVVDLIDYGIDAGTAYTITAYAPASAADLLQLHGGVSLLLALRIVQQAARGLAAAQRRGLVHGQLHLGALHLRRPPDFEHGTLDPGSVQVADIGLLSALSTHGSIMRVLDPAAWPYLCPEVARGRAPDPRSDVYALGWMLVHLLRGTPMHAPRSIQEVLAPRVASDTYRVASEHPDAPPALQPLIERVTAHSPEQRYADPAALAAALNSIIRQLDPQHGDQVDQLLPNSSGSMRALAPSRQAPTRPDPHALAAAEALRMAVMSAPTPPRPRTTPRAQDVAPDLDVVVVGTLEPGTEIAPRHRAATIALVALLVLMLGAAAFVWQRGGVGRIADAGVDEVTPSTSVVDTGAATETATTEPAEDVAAAASATLAALFPPPTVTSSVPANTPTRPPATATRTPSPTATIVPTSTPTPEPTATAALAVCSYSGAPFDGYVCDANGVFTVVLPNCAMSAVSIGWGDGNVTQQGETAAGTSVPHEYPAGTYQVHLEAVQAAPCTGTVYQSWIYEYVPGLNTTP